MTTKSTGCFLAGISGLVLLLCGCGIASPIKDFQRAELAGERVEDPSRAAAALTPISVPYSQIALSMDDGLPGRMVLATMQGEVQQWLSVDGRRIWIRGGRIVATDGFREDLRQLVPAQAPVSPLDAVAVPGQPLRTVLYAEPASGELGIIMKLSLDAADETQPVLTAGGLRHLRRVTEQVSIGAESRSWENVYWVDPERGTVEVSRQKLPFSGHSLRIERLYPSLSDQEDDADQADSRKGPVPVPRDQDNPVAGEQN